MANFQTWEKTDKGKEGRGRKIEKDKERKMTSRIKSAIRVSWRKEVIVEEGEEAGRDKRK